MPDGMPARSLARDPALVVAGVYEREVAASLERIWENVYDWEHLPWLHAEGLPTGRARTRVELGPRDDLSLPLAVRFEGDGRLSVEPRP